MYYSDTITPEKTPRISNVKQCKQKLFHTISEKIFFSIDKEECFRLVDQQLKKDRIFF